MQIVLTNKKPNSLITVIDRRTLRSKDLLFNESCTFFVESEEEVKDYRRSYEVFGVDISIKKPTEEFINPPVAEVKAEEPAKPKRSRRKSAQVESVSVENLTVKEVGAEEVKEEPKVEEPVVEEPAPEAPAEEPVKEETTEEK